MRSRRSPSRSARGSPTSRSARPVTGTLASALGEGLALIRAAAARASTAADRRALEAHADRIARAGAAEAVRLAADAELAGLMERHLDRTEATRSERELEVVVDRERARFAAWYELFPRSGAAPDRSATFTEAQSAARADRGHGLRRRLPAADPPDRPHAPQGAQQRAGRGARRSRESLGDRQRGRGPHRRPPRSRHARRLRPVRRRGAPARSRGCPRFCDPVLAGSSLGPGAPGVVLPPARRHHQVRREPAEEIPGHLPAELPVRGSAPALGRDAADPRILDRPRCRHVPRGQSPHEAGEVLGVADPHRPGRASRGDLPGRGVHPARR